MGHSKNTRIVVLTVLSLMAWAGVCFLYLQIQSDTQAFANRSESAQQALDEQASATRLHLLAQTSAHSREQLAHALQTDFVSVVDTIESIGAATGARVHVVDAVTDKPKIGAPSTDKTTSLHFVVSADGPFPAIVHAAQMIETLPMPASIESIDMSHVSTDPSNKTSWHLGIRIRVITNSQIGS